MLGRAVLERFASQYDIVPLRRADCDLADARATADAIAARAPRHIVHCAAWTDVDGCESNPERAWRDNAAATRNVALAAQAAGASLVYISTDYVFDGTKNDPYREDDPTSPLNVYGQSKRAGEEHVLREAHRAFVVRTSWLYGPGGKNFVHTMAALLGERDEVQVVNDQTGSPTYTRDLASALLLLVESDHYGLYHLANSGTCTWYELARAIAERTGSRCRVRPCTSAEYPRPARRPRNSVLEPYRWKQQGWPLPRHWTEALDEYLEMMSREPDSGSRGREPEDRGGGRA
jgi:dTDP-4-dehydrorhamnose reductase